MEDVVPVAEAVPDQEEVALEDEEGDAEGVTDTVLLIVSEGVCVWVRVAENVADTVADAVAERVTVTVGVKEGVALSVGLVVGEGEGVGVGDGGANANMNPLSDPKYTLELGPMMTGVRTGAPTVTDHSSTPELL